MIKNTLESFSKLNVTKDTLDSDKLKQMDELGYLLLEPQKKIFDFIGQDLDYLRDKTENLLEKEGDKAGYEGREEYYRKGKRFEKIASRLGNLPNKDKAFFNWILLPELLCAAHHVIKKDIMFSSSNFRDPLKDKGRQPMHLDWLPRTNENQNFNCIIAMMYLDDSNKMNGAIQAVPGTHKKLGYIEQHNVNPYEDHPDAITIEAKAGSIIIVNCHTWHRGGANVSGERRRIINAIYRNRNEKQGLNQNLYIDDKIKSKMTEAEKYIFKIRDCDEKQTEKFFGPAKHYREFLKDNPQFNYEI